MYWNVEHMRNLYIIRKNEKSIAKCNSHDEILIIFLTGSMAEENPEPFKLGAYPFPHKNGLPLEQRVNNLEKYES